MNSLSWILLSTFSLSAIALVGALTLLIKEKYLKKLIFPLVSFSAGTLLAGAFLHLIPESIDRIDNTQTIFVWVLVGFAIFFLLEQFIHWHHCHRAPGEHKHPMTYLILIADGIHNFLDGLVIGSAFVVDVRLGLTTTLAVAFHEIPQELGDFGILLQGGWSKGKAIFFNLLSGLTMVFGGVLVWLMSGNVDVTYLLPFAAGNFIYIAASDLIPEIKHNKDLKKNIGHFLAFFSGILLMYFLVYLK